MVSFATSVTPETVQFVAEVMLWEPTRLPLLKRYIVPVPADGRVPVMLFVAEVTLVEVMVGVADVVVKPIQWKLDMTDSQDPVDCAVA